MKAETPSSTQAFTGGRWISRSSRRPIRAALALTPPVVSPWAHRCLATTSTPAPWMPRTAARAIWEAR